jgi:hypothetical protein
VFYHHYYQAGHQYKVLLNITFEVLALFFCVGQVCDSYSELEIVYPDEVLRAFPSSISLSHPDANSGILRCTGLRQFSST